MIRVTVHGGADNLALAVEDDGSGFEFQRVRGRGLGLLNIEERVRELWGACRVFVVAVPGDAIAL